MKSFDLSQYSLKILNTKFRATKNLKRYNLKTSV